MKSAIKRRDLEMAVGMLMTYRLWKEAREKGKTISQFLIDALDGDTDMVEMFLMVADNHAKMIMLAIVDEHERMAKRGLDLPNEKERNVLIKQATVMSAIGESFLMLKDKSPQDLNLPDPDSLTEPDVAVLRDILDGLDPNMVKMVSEMIVSESYRNMTPDKDILAALWMEGFTVAALAETTFLVCKEQEFTKKFYATISKMFIILD